MIKIAKASKKDIRGWAADEWHKVDVIHYGADAVWNEKKFKFKATEDGKLLGYILGKHEAGVVYVESIITSEGARERGIGTLLIKKAESFGKKLGAHRIWLVTGIDWPENAFYLKTGFKNIGILPDLYYRKDFIIYSKTI
jgi:ribosomal protein S18 acetylase RimI-like enzyme